MFRSVSACTPNSVVTTEFTSSVNQEFNIWSNVTVAINGTVNNDRPIQLSVGDAVTAILTTPNGFRDYQFYPYTLDRKPQAFAVVNKNNYNPTIKIVDARKRWYNYLPKATTISWYNQLNSVRSVGTSKNIVDIDRVHIYLDAARSSVVFYSQFQNLVTRAYLPAAPIDYKKVPSTVPGYTKDLLVLCSDGRLYRVDYLNRAGGSEEFTPALVTSFSLDDLAFQEDIPGVGSFLDYAKSKLTAQLFPVVTSFDVANNIIWLVGSNTVYTLTLNFTSLATITIPSTEVILNIACVGNNAVVVTKTHKLFHVQANGTVVQVYQSSALGSPCTMPNSNQVAVPAGNEKKVYIFQEVSGTLSLMSSIDTPDFIPAYCEVFENNLWVTGHDSIAALKVTGPNSYDIHAFAEKVTLISVVGGSIMANHYLKDYVTLNLGGIEKIIPVTIEPRTGPVSHIGTAPILMKMLGQQGMTPIPGPGLTYFVNGRLGDGALGCNSGDYLGLSYKALSEGKFRSPVILGDTAYDYDVEVISSARVTDYFISTVTALNKLTTGFGAFPGLDSGDEDTGFTGPISLGFNFNFFGNVYNQVYVTTNGYLAFDNNNLNNNTPKFGSLGSDVLYVEPQDLYQGLPVNNVNPLNITTGFIENYQVPGVYYQEKQLAEFRSYRIKWVGTSMSSYPLGNTIITTSVSTSNWGEIPVPDIQNFQANDYISGGGIAISTKVNSKYAFSQNASMYFSDATNEYILVTAPATLPKYATVYLNTTVLGYVANTVSRSLSANAVLSDSGNTLVIDGTISPEVTTMWSFVRADKVHGAQSITVMSDSITPTTSVNSNYIQVALSDYSKPVVNQSLYGSAVTVPTKVTGFKTEFQRYQLTAYPSESLEGANVDISLYSYNIPLQNGAAFSYSITSSNVNVTSSDFDIPMTGTITVTGNYANITVPISADITANESIETFTFSVVPETGITLSVNVSIFDPGPVQFTAPTSTFANSATNLLYFVVANNTVNQVALDPIYFSKTEIDFGRAHPVGPTPLTYQYNRVNLINGTVLNSSTQYNINFSGNFAVVSPNVSIPASSNLLFKSNTFSPAYTYEVGFYVGKRFQYIEFFYDNQNHKFTDQIGLSAANTAAYSVSTNASANSSYVFGSETYNGDLKLIGKGSFTRINQGFQPRYVDINRVNADISTEVKYEFTLKQKIPVGLARLSLDYGQLRVNDADYDGTSAVKSNDIVSMVFPLSKNRMPAAAMVSVGDFQFAFPIVAVSEESKYPVVSTIYENQPNDTIMVSNIAIDQSGQYQLPAYYQNTMPGTGIDIEFNIIRSGNAIPWASGYAQLQAGDIVQVSNILTSSRLYDTKDFVLVGPKFYRNALRTSPGPLFNYLNYGTLQNPFVRYYVYDVSGNDDPAYKSANLRLSSASGSLISGLLVETTGISFLRNGAPAGTYISNANTTSNIALRVLLPNYFVSNIPIYQVKIDPWDAANVYIPIGHYAVNNLSIGTAVASESSRPLYVSTTAVDYGITTINKKFDPRVAGQFTQPAANIVSEYKQLAPTSGNTVFEGNYHINSSDKILQQPNQVGNVLTSASNLRKTVNWDFVQNRIDLLANGSTPTITVSIDDILSDAAMPNMHAYLDTLMYSKHEYNSLFLVTGMAGNLDPNLGLHIIELVSNVNQSGVESPQTESLSYNQFDIGVMASEQNSIMTFDDVIAVTSGNSTVSYDYIGDANQFNSEVQYDFVTVVTELEKPMSFNAIPSVTQFDSNMAFDFPLDASELVGSSTSNYMSDVTSFESQATSEYAQSNVFTHSMTYEFDPAEKGFGEIFSSTIYSELYFTKSMDFLFDNIKTVIERSFVSERIGDSDSIYKVFSAEIDSFINGIDLKFNAEIETLADNISKKFISELYVDELWDQGFNPNLGAITANIGVFADNGREGDMGLYQGVPAYRGPFVFYQKYYQLDPNGFLDQMSADDQAVKYVSASAIQLVGTDYWNYRIFFDTNKVCVPRKGLIFPVSWLIRGG